MYETLASQLKRLSPMQWAFGGSLLLSWIAVLGAATIGKDGAFYIDIAQTMVDQGASAALQRFNWAWFPMLLGSTHQLTGLPLETVAYLWCALLMAGTCALLVSCVQLRVPKAGYWAVLVVLAMPSFNTFRSDIIREHGFWFFSVLALWLALRWQARGGWKLASAIQFAIGAAALFRLEALLLCAALSLWLVPSLRSKQGWLCLVQLNALPLIGLLGFLLLLSGQGISQGRIEHYAGLLDPRNVAVDFKLLSSQFADSLKLKYSKDEAGQIVFFGVLAAILIKFIKLLGPFALPLVSRRAWSGVPSAIRSFAPFAYSWLLYVVVLLLFFFREQFINSRYVSFLDLLVVPLIAVVVLAFAGQFPRLAKALVVLALLVMLDNVVSLGAKKTHYIQAGHWLAANVERTDAVYYDDGRIGYYAGWGYLLPAQSREQAMSAESAEQYSYFVIEAEEDEPWLQSWLGARQRKVLAQFANRKGDTVLIIGQ